MATTTKTPPTGTIIVSPAKRTRAPRSKRAPVPTAKARENQTVRRTRRTTRTETPPPLHFRNLRDSDSDYEDDDGDPSPTLEELLTLVQTLKTTIDQQHDAIKEARTELKELKEEQRLVKAQNTDLQGEIHKLQRQVSDISGLLPPSKSWASVVAGSNTTQITSSTSTTGPKSTTELETRKEANCVRISTAPQRNDATNDSGFTRYLSTKVANKHIQEALHQNETTKDIKVLGVGTTKTGYVIRFSDPEAANIAKTHPEWLQELGNTTKLVKPLFGVVAHRFPTAGIDLDRNKEQAIDKIMEENDITAKNFKIDDIRWFILEGKTLGAVASLGIWFETAEAAKWTEMNGLVCDQRYIGNVEAYRMDKKRCRRCQKLGHLAWSCKEKMRCKRCCDEHDRRDCPPGASAKCADCDGPHITGSQGCPGPIIPRRQ